MSILIDKNTRVLVQGITGKEGIFHTEEMLKYGTKIVAGVTPGKGGQTILGVPVYDFAVDAVKEQDVNASIIFVPAPFAADAIMEALSAGIKLVVAITDGIPVRDMIKVSYFLDRYDSRLIGPNCPGIITPGECKIGIMPGHIFTTGKVGVISRSGTLTYEVVNALTLAGLGQSTCIGIGGDPIIGTSFTDALKLFKDDTLTSIVALIGEIGGSDEEDAANYIKSVDLPMVAFIAGRTAPPGKRMGHAGAIISGNLGTAEAKIKAFQKAHIPVADTVPDIVRLIKEIMS
ncbi:MAG TPA: succinate--CoA ligase subunit alpha [Candidatus Eremiobacteraeota bacterium]|nr:succinate--CoA ligase subunit alpha [Candidatus Eremiobacteraeota bacterium]